MPKYAQEKFEKGAQEKIVYWEATKHVHNAAMVTTVARWLDGQFGTTWTVRANSYQSNLSIPNPKAVLYNR